MSYGSHRLRVLVRERLSAGDSNEGVIQFVVSRYGDFVLLKPPFKMSTLALWLGPLAIIFAGLIAVVVFFRRRVISTTGTRRPERLSDDEKRHLEELLKDDAT